MPPNTASSGQRGVWPRFWPFRVLPLPLTLTVGPPIIAVPLEMLPWECYNPSIILGIPN